MVASISIPLALNGNGCLVFLLETKPLPFSNIHDLVVLTIGANKNYRQESVCMNVFPHIVLLHHTQTFGLFSIIVQYSMKPRQTHAHFELSDLV